MKRLSLEQAAKEVLAKHEGKIPDLTCPQCMTARAVLEAAKRAQRYRRNYGSEYMREIIVMGEMWSAMKRAARGKG